MVTQQQTWTINDIKNAARAAGSYWFDPDTLRFFKGRVLPSVYQGPGGIFFVSSEQYRDAPRGYTVRQFHPDNPTVMGTVGEFNVLTRDQAIRKAKESAAGSILGFSKLVPEEEGGVPWAMRGVKEVAEDFREVTILEQFLADLDKHSVDPSKVTQRDARAIITSAGVHHRLMERLSSDEAFNKALDAEGNHPQITANRAKIRQAAKRLGATGVIFSGDPRGCTVKLTFKDGFTNDFGGEGYCVPTSEKADDAD